MSPKHLSRRVVPTAAAALAIAAPVAGAHVVPATPASDAGYVHQGTHESVPPARDAAPGSIRELPPKLRSLARAEQAATAAYLADAGTPGIHGQPSASDASSGFDWPIAALAAAVLAGVLVALVSLGAGRARRHRAQTVGG